MRRLRNGDITRVVRAPGPAQERLGDESVGIGVGKRNRTGASRVEGLHEIVDTQLYGGPPQSRTIPPVEWMRSQSVCSPTAQKQQHHHGGEKRGRHCFLHHILDRSPHQHRLMEDRRQRVRRSSHFVLEITDDKVLA